MGKLSNKLSEKLKSLKINLGKKSQLALAGVLAVVMLIFFFKGINANKQESTSSTIDNEETLTRAESYNEMLEERLEKIISSIKGVGKTEVFIMTETSIEKIYATNEEQKNINDGQNSTKEIVFSKNGSSSNPVLKLEIYPKITGVLVVAEGVSDEKLRLMVINAVSVALDIENSKIEVLLGKSS